MGDHQKRKIIKMSIESNPFIVPLASTGIEAPKVQRADAADDAIDTEATEDLPLGIKLTGGAKLRADGLTGKGVKVAVIDSGVDRAHPGFDGMVKQQSWFRRDTPLDED